MKLAVLGYGTVGSGVVQILEENRDIISANAGEDLEIKYVLDLRDFPGDPIQKKIVHDYNVILNDSEVEMVVEVMGGVHPAYEFVKGAIENGKNAVTSNKELVAACGAELLELAHLKNVDFFFEASVGGGIPVIRPMIRCLTADRILKISGILNGTTNYMLTCMEEDGASYDDVLRQAQEMGFAERDPSADVEGWDACRKIAILSSLAGGQQVDYREIRTIGITGITQADFRYAAALGLRIRLLARASFAPDGIYVQVGPALVSSDDPLYAVKGVYNAVKITGDRLGDVMLYGQGAGKDATASAVVSDIIEAARTRRNPYKLKVRWDEKKLALSPIGEYPSRFLVRLRGRLDEVKDEIQKKLQPERFLVLDGLEDEFAVVTSAMSDDTLARILEGEPGRFISRMYLEEV